MRATIDRAGRLVVPKALRDALGFRDGEELELSARDGRLEAEVVPARIHLERGPHGHLRAVSDDPVPPLSAEQVREVLEQTRR